MKGHSIRKPFQIASAFPYHVHGGNGIAIVKKYRAFGQECPDCDAVQSFAQFRVQVITSLLRRVILSVAGGRAPAGSVITLMAPKATQQRRRALSWFQEEEIRHAREVGEERSPGYR
jgi:hypothetical protein